MLRFAANLSLLFTEVPLAGRFALARQAGFSAVEIQFPYELPVADLQRRGLVFGAGAGQGTHLEFGVALFCCRLL